ncbi:hypothetical protein V6N13_053730 [Hibiscus sabdariffa]
MEAQGEGCPRLDEAIIKYQDDNDVEGCQEGAHIGSLQLLNGIQSNPKIETKGLLFLDVAINGKATRAMVDTGIEFVDQVKAISISFVNAMSITEGNQACVVLMIRGTKQEIEVLSALQLEEEDTNRGSLATTMLALATCNKGKSQVQHRGAKRRRPQTDKKQRPPRFKEGFTRRGGKLKIRRSIPTIPQRPCDEGIAGLGGGACHDLPPCPRLSQGKTRTMGKFSDKNASKKDIERFNMVYTPLGVVQDDREGTRSIKNQGVRCQGPKAG